MLFADDDSSTPCDAVLVNAHGGALQARKKLPVGDIVVLRHTDGSKTTVTCSVRSCVPLGTSKTEWLIGVELDHPGNFWKVPNPPQDWGADAAHVSAADGGKAMRGAHAAAQNELEKFHAELRNSLEEFRARELTALEDEIIERIKKTVAAARDEAISAIEAAAKARTEKVDQFANLQTRKAESLTQAAIETLDEIVTKKLRDFEKRCDQLAHSGKRGLNGRDES
jgi:hypothetical protein